jgi:hypothetical protein
MTVALPFPAAPWRYEPENGQVVGNDGRPVVFIFGGRMDDADLAGKPAGTASRIGFVAAAAPDLFAALEQSCTEMESAAKIVERGGWSALAKSLSLQAQRNRELLDAARGHDFQSLGVGADGVVHPLTD